MNPIHSVQLFERNGIGILVYPAYDDDNNNYALTVIVYLPKITAYIPYKCANRQELDNRMSTIKNNEEEREKLLRSITDQITISNQQPDNESTKQSPDIRRN